MADDAVRRMKRRLRAVKGALAMHAKHPGLAREAGRKGAATTLAKFGGPALWGQQMSLRRWSGKRFKLQDIQTLADRHDGVGAKDAPAPPPPHDLTGHEGNGYAP